MSHLPSPAFPREPTADEKMGMAWWNHLSRPERRAALAAAATKLGRDPSAIDAWTTWKSSALITSLESGLHFGCANRITLARSYSPSPLPTGSTLAGKAGCRSPGT